MPDFRHKREGGDIGFLVRGSLDGCVSSCSSTRGGADAEDDDLVGDDAPDLLARRRRRSDLDGDDIAESSAAARRHSRILSRWVARHAEVMITNIERRNRESELMALAGLQTVSTLDDSFLRGSQRSPSSVERPVAARASAILQMWRELEDMSSARERRTAAAGRGNRTMSGSRAATESDDNRSIHWDRGPLGPIDREDSMEDDADRSSSREQSPDLGDGETERVRQIVRGWTSEDRMRDLSASELSLRTESPRSEWLGANERERVRLVREWVQMASEQRDARSVRRVEIDSNHNRDGSATIDHTEGRGEHVSRTSLRVRGRQARLDLIMRMARERQRELQGLSEARAVSGFPHRCRIQSFLRGRFLRNGSTAAEDERPLSVAATELGQLRQRHPVSGLREEFRFRLQSIDDGQHISQVDNISIHDVSDSRNDQSQSANAVELSNYNDNRSESTIVTNDDPQVTETIPIESNRPVDDMDWQESVDQAEIWQEEALEVHARRDWQLSVDGGLGEWHNEVGEESDGTWHENTGQSWFQRTPEGGVNGHLPESDDWHDNDSQVTVENWLDEPSHSPQNQYDIPIRTVNRFVPSDDDNVYSVELRELLSRRSVSNLLHSGFRESLDRLIRSYVQRQGRVPLDWDIQRISPTPASTEEDLEEQRDTPREDQQDSIERPPVVIPPPPVPPRQPFWHSLPRHNNWNRQSMRRTETEWDAVNELRAELARLQQAMSNMQRMLEACMDMQLELQRSVRQEVSAALNRSKGGEGLCEEWSDDGSMWTNVKNGTCCVCCDCHIDSLLYRCGHMCTCSKCANELVRSGGKCPLCRAPIIEVIRAYSIL